MDPGRIPSGRSRGSSASLPTQHVPQPPPSFDFEGLVETLAWNASVVGKGVGRVFGSTGEVISSTFSRWTDAAEERWSLLMDDGSSPPVSPADRRKRKTLMVYLLTFLVLLAVIFPTTLTTMSFHNRRRGSGSGSRQSPPSYHPPAYTPNPSSDSPSSSSPAEPPRTGPGPAGPRRPEPRPGSWQPLPPTPPRRQPAKRPSGPVDLPPEKGGPQVSSPTHPNALYKEPGCPALGKPPQGKRYIQVKNNCETTIWPGVLPPGSIMPPDRSWAWEPGVCKTMEIASGLPAFRIWARTQCDENYKCVTGSCLVDGSGMCGSAGEAPCSLWEATLQDHCTESPSVGLGPDFYDQSLVDGFNVPIQARVSGGWNVGQVPPGYSCQPPVSNAFSAAECPFELRVYSDQIPGTNLPMEGLNGVDMETSPCFKTPTDPDCVRKVVGCRSLCKSVDQGWIGFYIDNVQGPEDQVNPILLRPNGEKIRWADQFLQGKSTCGVGRCADHPAWGAFRGEKYASGGQMKNLVCCDMGFRCSPYQNNGVPGGCPYQQACPTLGAGDPASPYHRSWASDLDYPQANQDIRKSSSYPDWPMPTRGNNYAQIYKVSSPDAYSWQFNDFESTYTCCGKAGEGGPSYIVTFCP